MVLGCCAAALTVALACSPDEQPDIAATGAEGGAGGATEDAGGASSGFGGSIGESAGAPGDAGGAGAEHGAPSIPTDGASASIGPDGGGLELDGVIVTVPPGALATPTTLTLKKVAVRPSGYELYSSAFALLPRETTFDVPVTIKLPLVGDSQLATVFASRHGSTGYVWLPTEATEHAASVDIVRGGTFFVANGVEYEDAPDSSCSAVDVLDGAVSMRREVTLFAQASDCQERPLVGLTEKDLVAVEDGEGTSASVALRDPPPVAAFATVLVDLNVLKAAPTEFQAALRASIARAGSTTTRIGLSVYGGAGEPSELVAPTLDRDRLTQALDGLAGFSSAAKEPSSFAALVSSATGVAQAAREFRDRNLGGAFGGSFVLWIPGSESSESVATQSELLQKVMDDGVRIIAAPLGSGSGVLGPENVYPALDGRSFARALAAAVQRLNGYIAASYLAGFCTQKDAGVHTAGLRIANGAFRFGREAYADLTGSLPFCDEANPLGSCDGRECGGLGCGSCDDTNAACDAATSTCRSFCDSEHWCGGVAHENPLGYAQSCEDTPKSSECSGACVDLQTDSKNCGTCGVVCPSGAKCVGAVCACPGGQTLCGEACIDTSLNPKHCGSCGNQCKAGEGCFSGKCAAECPTSQHGPALVKVPTPSGGIMCIDATEVTQAHYAEFLAEKSGDASGQRPECALNLYFDAPEGCLRTVPVPSNPAEHPQQCVDWCDAAAYCEWAGKRLCGHVEQGAVAWADGSDAAKDQWFNACSSGGANTFPFGATCNASVCNWSNSHSVEVGSQLACQAQGPYAGVYDLSGNAGEWEDSCTGYENLRDSCRVRGGSYQAFAFNCFRPTDDLQMRCATGDDFGFARRDYAGPGFRCCGR
ncbi:MAG: SUMF1/EgtB/PvdO family nonheme iron enzyme [Myxococcota bacterium]